MANNTFAAQAMGWSKAQPSLMRSLAMYGANAAGKTTLIKALSFLDEFVLNSHQKQVGDLLDVTPFKLDALTQQQDSEFEIEIIANEVRYVYGVSCNKHQVNEEWLFAYPEGKPQKWFNRVFDGAAQKYRYKYSNHFLDAKAAKLTWEAETKDNELFLSLGVKKNSSQLRPVFDWFKNTLRVLGSANELSGHYTKRLCLENSMSTDVVQFMQHADLGIVAIDVAQTPLSVYAFPKDMPLKMRQKLAEEFKGHSKADAIFTHSSGDGNATMQLSEDEESDGTKAMFAFVGPWLDIQKHNRVLVVDELDTSLHPLVVHQLVELFHQQTKQNGNHAQLIFTTHDATLLSKKILRKDQIWFLEKNQQGATQTYSLADINDVRADAPFEKAYLNGRYGGIPFMKALDFHGE